MLYYLLDAGGPFLLIVPLFFFMIVCILFEAITMIVLKMNRFGKSLGDSAIVNIASLLLGFLLVSVLNRIEFDEVPFVFTFSGLYLVTVLAEGALLKALNKSKPWRRIFFVSVIMNLITYLILYGFIKIWS